MNRRNIVLAVCAVLLLIVSYSIYRNYQNRYQYLILSSNQSFEFKLYKHGSSLDGLDYNDKGMIFSSNKSGKYKIKRGAYIYVASRPSKDYAPIIKPLSLSTTRVLVSINDFKYTDQKLQSLLITESPGIENLINNSYPLPMANYSIASPKLYYTGQWYGAVLVPKDALNQDTYRIVLKKKDGRWSVVTTPPSIILSQPVYPNIPFDILSDLNNKGSD
jgi:hypothetical protein